MLKENKSITYFYISGTIDCLACKSYSKMLQVTKTLKSLFIYSEEIKKYGCKFLTDALSTNIPLESFNLFCMIFNCQ